MNASDNPVRSSGATQSISDNKPSCSKSQEVSSLVIRNINESFSLKIYPNCVEYKYLDSQPIPRPLTLRKRSCIKQFTKRARFRLFASMAKIKRNLDFQPIFITLTYHHGHEQKTKSTKSQLHHFLVQLRNYDPTVEFIWRFEFQKRGAPHYHLIIFPGNPPFGIDEESYGIRISNIWHGIADPNSRAHAQYGCKIVHIDSYRKACAYLSKYIAKTPEEETEHEVGKHWGCSRNLPYELIESTKGHIKHAGAIIEKLRTWLIEHGKEQYADPLYFNQYRNQTVFISYEDYYILDREGKDD